MSYCRLSSVCEDGHLSDVYVYLSDFGFMVHIATLRINNSDDDLYPPNPWNGIDDFNYESFLEYERMAQEWKERNEVNKSSDFYRNGQSFTFETAKECGEFLIDLKNHGVHVPQYAIDELVEEENDFTGEVG